MQVKALELVPRCTNCYGDSPKAYKREQIQPMAKVTSEYQAAYRDLPWQPRPPSLKPEQKNVSAERNKSHMERKSTYGIDFVYNPLPKKLAPKKHKSDDKGPPGELADDPQFKVFFPKKAVVSRMKSPNVENAKVIHPSNSQPFQGDTIYNAAYTSYDLATMAASQQPPIKAKDNIENRAMREADVQRSTAQDDFIHHENAKRPVAVRLKDNTERPTEPIDQSTEYKDFYTKILQNANLCKAKPDDKFEAISTAMADFTKPEGFEKPVPCPPPVSNHFVTAKFDGTTTFNMAYKPFPVKRYELPIWAKKPIYKRPKGGMIVNTLYMHDYRDPQVVKRPAPIYPDRRNKNVIIKNDKGDRRFEDMSTYKYDFRLWEDVHPRETYRTIEVYQPPREKMVCETNQRSHFTGVKANKMKPCRHTSQHRELNTDTGMTFVTTYTENFRNPRPKSTPSKGCEAPGSAQQRVSSAKQATAESPGIPKSTPNKIPTPYLSITPGNEKADMAANNSAVKAGQDQGQVNILKIVHTCETCNRDERECRCAAENT